MEPTDIFSIVNVAKKVSEEFYYSKGVLSLDNFVKIIEACSKWPIINFFDWTFYGEQNHAFNSNIDYEIKDISIHNWWDDEEPDKLKIDDLDKLISQMSKTSMMRSLRTVQVEKSYKSWKKLK